MQKFQIPFVSSTKIVSRKISNAFGNLCESRGNVGFSRIDYRDFHLRLISPVYGWNRLVSGTLFADVRATGIDHQPGLTLNETTGSDAGDLVALTWKQIRILLINRCRIARARIDANIEADRAAHISGEIRSTRVIGPCESQLTILGCLLLARC